MGRCGRWTHNSYKAQRKARGQWPAGRHYHKASHRVQCRRCPERGWRRGSVGGKVGSRSPDRHARCSLGRGERVLDNSATQRHISKIWERVCLCERERERERERETERQRDRETERQRQTETDRDRQRQTETDRDRQRQRQTETDRDRRRQTETDRDRQNQTETDGDRPGQTEPD